MSDADNVLTLDSKTVIDIENVKAVLDMLPRRIEKGCIVKIRREVLFNPSTRQQLLSYPHIYRIVTNLEKVYHHTGLRAWEVRWFFIHACILPSDHVYSYLSAQIETDMLIVNWPEDEDVAVGEDYRLKWYFTRVDDS